MRQFLPTAFKKAALAYEAFYEGQPVAPWTNLEKEEKLRWCRALQAAFPSLIKSIIRPRTAQEQARVDKFKRKEDQELYQRLLAEHLREQSE